MTVLWSKKGKKGLEEIFQFEFPVSPRYAVDLYNRIIDEVEKLADGPYIAAREPSLENEPDEFRALVVARRYKAIYHVDEAADTVVVTDVWDCRQNPAALSRRAKK